MHGTPLQKKKTKNIGRNRLKQSFYYFLFKWTQYSKNLEIALEQAMQSPKTLLEKISNVLFRCLIWDKFRTMCNFIRQFAET